MAAPYIASTAPAVSTLSADGLSQPAESDASSGKQEEDELWDPLPL